jgi:hypothetical protein
MLSFTVECYGRYVRIPDLVIITDGDGMGPWTRVHVVGCSPDSACLYHRQVMNARPRGRGASHVYPEAGSP